MFRCNRSLNCDLGEHEIECFDRGQSFVIALAVIAVVIVTIVVLIFVSYAAVTVEVDVPLALTLVLLASVIRTHSTAAAEP